MIFLVYKRHAIDERGCVPKLIGAVSNVDSITEACEKLKLKFSMPDSIALGCQVEHVTAYKKSGAHKTQFFLKEVRTLQTKSDI